MLNNALANGNPNAVIVATFNTTFASGGDPPFFTSGAITVLYDADGTQCGNSTPGRWYLNVESSDASALREGQRFNLIVMNPTP
jgi:hypothetical protein